MAANWSPWQCLCPMVLAVSWCILITGQVHGQVTCPPDQILCSNGTECVIESFVCDGDFDCTDQSDEAPSRCFHESFQCTEEQFECTANKEAQELPICIPLFYICDEDRDCSDGADETTYNCTQFWEDYWGDLITTPAPPSRCPGDEFYCPSDMQCIPRNLQCDTMHDCTSGADEEGCTYTECQADQFRCHSMACVDKRVVCNGIRDCKDGSDEDEVLCGTPRPVCNESQYQCQNGKCVSWIRQLCNGVDDCGDNSDETVCNQPFVNECENATLNQCGGNCMDLPFGYKCTCDAGYTLDLDGKTCRDVNECTERLGSCQQVCRNEPTGNFSCECVDGYSPVPGKRGACMKNDNISPYLVFGNKYFVRRMNTDGTGQRPISQDHTYTHVMDFDLKDQVYYYADAPNLQQVIKKMNFDGSGMQIIERQHVPGIEGMAFDWINKKLYWTNNKQGGIFVSESNGDYVKVLLEASSLPRAITLHPKSGYMFWTDWSLEPFIARVGMDGSMMRKIIDKGLFWPNGLTIDYATDKLWWADAHLDTIKSADMDGSNIQVVLKNLPHPYALTVFEEWVYWTEWNLLKVEKANRFTGGERSAVAMTVHMPYDIHVIHPLRQPLSPNPCGQNKGGCSHLCLIAPLANGTGVTFSCACPENYLMGADGKTCAANCTAGHFQCPGRDGNCIPLRMQCDGRDDCEGREDEADCPADRACEPNYYSCKNTTTRQCVPLWQVCDQTIQCRNGSDETTAYCSTAVCLSYEFRCNSGQCIPKSWVCDGDFDCNDKSDEQPLHEQCTKCEGEDQFKCTNGKCIPLLWRCDWDNDCGDMSDEPRTECHNTSSCPEGWIRCGTNYRCIPKTNLCDGQDDCRNNWDEEPANCPQCPAGDFQCKNGTPKCIPHRWACDFREDCDDGSDENLGYCASRYRNCSDAEYRCRNQKCINKDKLCNSVNDCQDRGSQTGSDELACGAVACTRYQFKCNTGQCIDIANFCDGIIQCDDASDETRCGTRLPDGSYCRPELFTCANKACIPRAFVCDGEDDCKDNSDEVRSACVSQSCDSQTNFRCTLTQRCVPNSLKCDGKDDCGDNTDEQNCAPTECSANQYQCKNDNCIPASRLCNGRNDCMDGGNGSDESGCVSGSACTNRSCEYRCVDVQVEGRPYHKCECRKGFEHSSMDNCIDVDECSSFKTNICPHTCVNNRGSYGCKCDNQFTDDTGTGHFCSSKSNSYILFSLGNELRKLEPRSQGETEVIMAQLRAEAMDFDIENEIIYWSDTGTKKLLRAKIPQNPGELGIPQDLGVEDLGKVMDIAYDWMGDNLYYIDSEQKTISVTRSNWKFQKTLLRVMTSATITSIAVNSERGLMYWSELSSSSSIRYGNMSGEGYDRKIVYGSLWEPGSIVVDHLMGGRIFWVDRRKSTLETATYDGSDHAIIKEIDSSVGHPFHLDVFNADLYWTKQSSREIHTTDKFGAKPEQAIFKTSYMASVIRIFNKQKYDYSQVINRCAALSCPGLCLPEVGGARCVCPDKWQVLGSNPTKCVRPDQIPVLPKPMICSCQNGGRCVIHDAEPVCKCRFGFSGVNCESKSGGGSPGSLPTTPYPIVTPQPVQQKGGNAALNAAIAVPVVIGVIIIGLVILVIFWIQKRGNLSKTMSGHGEIRPGRQPGSNGSSRVRSGTPHDHITAEAAAYEHGIPVTREISFEDGAVRFNNPIYDTVQKTNSSNTAPAPERTVTLKQDINTNYKYSPSDLSTDPQREPPSIAEAVAGLAEVHLDLREPERSPSPVQTKKYATSYGDNNTEPEINTSPAYTTADLHPSGDVTTGAFDA